MTALSSTFQKAAQHLPASLVMRLAFACVNKSNITHGSIRIDAPSLLSDSPTTIFQAQGQKDGPNAHIRINDPAMIQGMMEHGSLRFGEAYMNGEWEVAGQESLTKTMESFLVNEKAFTSLIQGNSTVRRQENEHNKKQHAGNANNDQQAIQAHYDTALIENFLGNFKVYTSGVRLRDCPPGENYGVPGNEGDTDLEDWQQRKMNRILHVLNPQANHQLLDIGCGYGTLAIEAAKMGYSTLGITLSATQLDYAQAEAQRLGLGDKAKFEMRDYRDLAQARSGLYDRVMSVGMAEHVDDMSCYMQSVHRLMPHDGQALIHLITLLTDEKGLKQYNQELDFMQKYIFPNGKLTTNKVVVDAANDAGLSLKEHFHMGHSYGDTLEAWHDNFQGAWTKLAQQEKRETGQNEFYTPQEKRKWEFYLCSCAAAFYADNIDVNQFHFVKGSAANQADYRHFAYG